jgi:hypothetical protein
MPMTEDEVKLKKEAMAVLAMNIRTNDHSRMSKKEAKEILKKLALKEMKEASEKI